VLIVLNIKTMPPALIETVASSLNKPAYYIGDGYEQAHAAWRHWKEVSPSIYEAALEEVENTAKAREYRKLSALIKMTRNDFASDEED
jgi:hypothetical protein